MKVEIDANIPLPPENDSDIFDELCDPNNPKSITYEDVKSAAKRLKEGIVYTACKEQAKRGVIACSAGNHAQALAYHGYLLKIPVTVVMPVNASLLKITNCRNYGANVILKGASMFESKRYALKLAKMYGLTHINGYDHPQVLAGQGTVGIEILEQVPDADAIIVPVGGGGLIAGISVAVKAIRPEIRVIGVESNRCAGFSRSLAAGKPVYTECLPSCTDGLAIPLVGGNSLYTCKDLVEKVIVIDEIHVHHAILRLLEVEKCVVEGSGAISLAIIIAGLVPELVGKKVVAILTGGNIDTTLLGRIIDRGLAFEGRICRFIVHLSDQVGSIADLCLLLKKVGASVKDISHERIWLKSSIFNVQVKCVCETCDSTQAKEVEKALREKYNHVLWGNEALW